MPNCFALSPKTDPNKDAPFVAIDNEMREHFKEPADPVQYLCRWYDVIGFRLACGRSFPEIKQAMEELVVEFPDDPMATRLVEIVQYLDEHYTARAWAEIGRR